MTMEFIPERKMFRGWLADGAGIEITPEQFFRAPTDLRESEQYWDEWVTERCDKLSNGADPLGFVEGLSETAREFISAWLPSPWSLAEMVELFEDWAVLQELEIAGLIRYIDGRPVLDATGK